MRVLVCGGRDYTDRTQFLTVMHSIAEAHFPRTSEDNYGNYLYAVTIVAGGARGADRLAWDWSVVNWTDYKEFPANWDKYGKRAGYIRNKQMLDEGKPDLVVAFPGGKGTDMMVDIALNAGVKVLQVRSDGSVTELTKETNEGSMRHRGQRVT